MGRRLGNDFLLSTEPQRGTVRVQFALLPETREEVAMDTVAMVARKDPEKQIVVDTLASPLAEAADLMVEALWTDSVTCEVLLATIARHFLQAVYDSPSFRTCEAVNPYLLAFSLLVRYPLCSHPFLPSFFPPSPPLAFTFFP